MTNDLASPEDLAGLPGAPFTDEQVDAAVAAVRRAAQWHIAPEQEDTVTLDVECRESFLRLPTRHLVSVEEIRDLDATEIIDPDDYRVSLNLGQVKRGAAYWPSGYAAVEVDITHGYEETPPDLFAIIASAIGLVGRDAAVRGVRIDDFSAQFASEATIQTLKVMLGDYALETALMGLGIA